MKATVWKGIGRLALEEVPDPDSTSSSGRRPDRKRRRSSRPPPRRRSSTACGSGTRIGRAGKTCSERVRPAYNLYIVIPEIEAVPIFPARRLTGAFGFFNIPAPVSRRSSVGRAAVS